MLHLEFAVLFRTDQAHYWTVDGVNVDGPDHSMTLEEVIHTGRETMRLTHGNNPDFFAVGPLVSSTKKKER